MGCTPSKQIDASREDCDLNDCDSSFADQSSKSEVCNSNGNSNSNGNGIDKAKTKSSLGVDVKLQKSRKCTQSQLDFFEMLDKRIEEGADYTSEDERAQNAWTEARFLVACGIVQVVFLKETFIAYFSDKNYDLGCAVARRIKVYLCESYNKGTTADLHTKWQIREATMEKFERKGDSFKRRRTISSRACGQYQSNNLHRKHYYGSLDKLFKETKPDDCLLTPGRKIQRFRVEPAIGDLSGAFQATAATHLENPEFQTRWYFKYFLGQVHNNYIGLSDQKEPYALSVCLTASDNHGIPQYRAILWKASGCQRLCFPYKPAKIMSPREVLRMFSSVVDKVPYEVTEAEIQRELIVLEEQEGSVNFKFGVIYAKAGQVTDNEMFSNATGSESFEEFLDLLGDRITLKGFKKYKGGLDVKNNTTGTESVHTVSEGHEIMFHVSTLLPHSKNHSQQVERKRHIGNDIVVIVYIDGPPSRKPAFSPSFIRSKFTQCFTLDLKFSDIFAVVYHDKADGTYWLYVYSEEHVPVFGPPLPNPSVFHDAREFRSILITKLMNGEKATYFSPVFSQKRQRTLEALLKGLHTDHSNLRERFSLRRSFRGGTPRSPRRSRKKNEGRRRAFVETGQLLKVNKILQGDAPTSLANSSGAIIPRSSPWQPDCISSVFPSKINCGDSFGEGLVLATDHGLYTVQGDLFRHIFDSTLQVQQINVLETQGICILRTKKTRAESKVYVLPISELESTDNRTRSKDDLRRYKLNKTKGGHVYALNRPGSIEILLAVAVRRKICLFVWRVTPMWTFRNGSDTPAGFEFEREFRLVSIPSLLCIAIDSNNDVLLCCGYKDRFDLVNVETKKCQVLRKLEGKKINKLVSALDVYEDDNPEILLTYNHFSIFQRFDANEATSVSFYWNSTPHAVVCAFPYVIGFTSNTVEIRLVVNGNLVHTIAFPNVQFITGKSDIYFSTSKKVSDEELMADPSKIKRMKHRKRPRHIVPTSVYRIALNSLVGSSLLVATNLTRNDEVFSTPAKWDSSENEDELDSTPIAYSAVSTVEEQIRLRRKYSNATAMADPIISPALMPVAKMIDFGEEIGDSSIDLDSVEPSPVRLMHSASPVAASDPDLTRAMISKKKRLKALLHEKRNSVVIRESSFKQETLL
eukprot:gene15830-17426_t